MSLHDLERRCFPDGCFMKVFCLFFYFFSFFFFFFFFFFLRRSAHFLFADEAAVLNGANPFDKAAAELNQAAMNEVVKDLHSVVDNIRG
jgi:hypothetical protein